MDTTNNFPFGKIKKEDARNAYIDNQLIWLFPDKVKRPWENKDKGRLVKSNRADFDLLCAAFRYIIQMNGTGKGIHFYHNKEV